MLAIIIRKYWFITFLELVLLGRWLLSMSLSPPVDYLCDISSNWGILYYSSLKFSQVRQCISIYPHSWFYECLPILILVFLIPSIALKSLRLQRPSSDTCSFKLSCSSLPFLGICCMWGWCRTPGILKWMFSVFSTAYTSPNIWGNIFIYS